MNIVMLEQFKRDADWYRKVIKTPGLQWFGKSRYQPNLDDDKVFDPLDNFSRAQRFMRKANFLLFTGAVIGALCYEVTLAMFGFIYLPRLDDGFVRTILAALIVALGFVPLIITACLTPIFSELWESWLRVNWKTPGFRYDVGCLALWVGSGKGDLQRLIGTAYEIEDAVVPAALAQKVRAELKGGAKAVKKIESDLLPPSQFGKKTDLTVAKDTVNLHYDRCRRLRMILETEPVGTFYDLATAELWPEVKPVPVGEAK